MPETRGLQGLGGGRTRARTWDPMIKSHWVRAVDWVYNSQSKAKSRPASSLPRTPPGARSGARTVSLTGGFVGRSHNGQNIRRFYPGSLRDYFCQDSGLVYDSGPLPVTSEPRGSLPHPRMNRPALSDQIAVSRTRLSRPAPKSAPTIVSWWLAWDFF